MRIDYLRTSKGLTLYNDILTEIRHLPQDNPFHRRLIKAEERYKVVYPERKFDMDERECDLFDIVADIIQEYNNINSNKSITIIDSIMGSGKTTYILNYINNHPERRYLIVVPTIDKTEEKDGYVRMGEVGRYLKHIKAETYEPEPRPTKKDGLKHLLKIGANIVTTHALIQRIDLEIMDLIKKQNYTLIIDEVLDCVHPYEDHFNKSDLKLLLLGNTVKIDEDGFIKWTDKLQDHNGKYENFKNLCNLKSLMVFKKKDGTFSDSIVIWNMPIRFFSLFKKCYILTYLFEGSFQASYFKLNGIQYMHKTILNGVLAPYSTEAELIQRKEKFELMKFINNDRDKQFFVSSRNPFTDHWYKERKNKKSKYHNEIVELKNSVYNILRNKIKCESEYFIWTTFKDYKSIIKGKGYTKQFLPCNSKGTNDYQKCEAVAYLINRYPPADLVNFFKSYQVDVNKDLFGLSEMLQWIWRSRIRNNLAIKIYLPSLRMRNLLVKWKDGKI